MQLEPIGATQVTVAYSKGSIHCNHRVRSRISFKEQRLSNIITIGIQWLRRHDDILPGRPLG